MSESWSLDVLRTHAETLGAQRDALVEVVDSIGEYVDIFLYHFASARDAMKGLVYDDDPTGAKNLQYIFGTADKQIEFKRAKIRSQAHIVAVANTTRALYDVFSHLVNGFVLENALPTAACDIRRAAERVPPSGLKQELDELLKSYWFDYLSAFTNVVKHRKFVRQGFHVAFDGSPPGVRIQGFEYNGKTFAEYAANEFLVGVLEVKNRVVACGCALNSTVPSFAHESM